jgi:hypothetical protein
VSALAHWLEEEGIATTLVALFRPHAETVRPPRALWVPFELGRPLGPPMDPDFQRGVLQAALELLESEAGAPLLVDYPLDDPDAEPDPAWQCPVAVGAPDLVREIAQVKPHYERAVEIYGRTTVGLSDIPIEKAGAFLSAYLADEKAERPRAGMSPASLMRFCADDVKAYYLEAAGSGDGSPSSRQMTDWFWNQTVAGAVIKDLRRGSAGSPDKQRQALGDKGIVPGIYQD